MSYLEIIESVLEKQKQDKVKQPPKDISLLRLSELAKRNMAIEIYSEILGCNLWLCSNEEMATQVREEEPGAVIYTVDEVKRLIYLNPNPDDIRRIHATKLLFPGSNIINSKLQEDSDE